MRLELVAVCVYNIFYMGKGYNLSISKVKPSTVIGCKSVIASRAEGQILIIILNVGLFKN